MEEVIGQTKPKKRFMRCGVSGCKSSWDPDLRFFSLPTDSERKMIWLRNIGRSTDTWSGYRLFVCEKHFESKYINNNTRRRRLLKAAVPTLLLPESNEDSPSPPAPAVLESEQPDPIAPTTSSHTEDASAILHASTSVQENQPPIKRFKIKEEPYCLTVFVDEESEDEHDKTVVDKKFEYIPQTDVPREMNNKLSRQKYSTEYKNFALELYFTSPNSYRLFQKTLRLPRISTLYRMCFPTNTMISQSVLKALTIKANSMTMSQKQCVLCVGTMSLVPNIHYDSINDKIIGFHEVDGVQALIPARNVLVVMVRGLFHNWKQAVAYALLADIPNQVNIEEIILKMFQVGLNVRVLMSDLESDTLIAAKDRGFNSRQPFFTLNSRKIFYMYDPLHLMRNIRYNLMIHNFIFYSGMVAKWHIILECYEHDCKKGLLRLAPKLSKDHIKPVKGAVNDLKLTAELFSKATATAISTYIDLKMLPANAKDTVQWIVTMNKLMEMLNFSTIHPPEDKSALFTGDSSQVDFLVGMLSLFYNMRLISGDVNNVPKSVEDLENTPFIEGFRVTINAVLLLYGALKTEDCWLPIVGLSQDCLDEFFDKVRLKHGYQPTSKQVIQCITNIPIFNIFQYSCKKRSPNDLEYFTSHARNMSDIDIYEQETTDPYEDMCAAESVEFYGVELPRVNKMEHLALYLLYKGYKRHSDCPIMKKYACTEDLIEGDSSVMPFVGYKHRGGDKTNIPAVPPQFIEFIAVMGLKFKEYFKEKQLTNPMSGLLAFVKNVTFEMPCECFPIDFIKQLYLRYRLYSTLRYNNRSFRAGGCTPFKINDL